MGTKSAATNAEAPNVSPYTGNSGSTMVKPSTSTSTIKKIGSSETRRGAPEGAGSVVTLRVIVASACVGKGRLVLGADSGPAPRRSRLRHAEQAGDTRQGDAGGFAHD